MNRSIAPAVLAALVLAAASGDAAAHGRWHFGIGIGLPIYPAWPGYYYAPAYPAYPAYGPPPAAMPEPAPVPRPVPPDPIFYPRNGQSPAQLEADRQACNRWATTQPDAVADASVFHRATLACMDGRGYSAR